MYTGNRARSASTMMRMCSLRLIFEFPVSLKFKKELSDFEKMRNLHHL